MSQKRDFVSDISGIVSQKRDLVSDIVSQKRDFVSDIVSQKRDFVSDMSQKRDFVSDCQKCYGRTDGRGEMFPSWFHLEDFLSPS